MRKDAQARSLRHASEGRRASTARAMGGVPCARLRCEAEQPSQKNHRLVVSDFFHDPAPSDLGNTRAISSASSCTDSLKKINFLESATGYFVRRLARYGPASSETKQRDTEGDFASSSTVFVHFTKLNQQRKRDDSGAETSRCDSTSSGSRRSGRSRAGCASRAGGARRARRRSVRRRSESGRENGDERSDGSRRSARRNGGGDASESLGRDLVDGQISTETAKRRQLDRSLLLSGEATHEQACALNACWA